MSYRYHSNDHEIDRLPSGLFFTRLHRAEHLDERPYTRSLAAASHQVPHDNIESRNFVIRQDRDNELYLPLLEVRIEVEVVATIAWTRLIQTFTNRATHPIREATYCFPLYDNSTVTAFNCSIGSNRILKGIVKAKVEAKAEYVEAVARQRVTALLEEHTPEVFETNIGNIPAQTTVKIEICYITELKADLSGDGISVIIPTSVAPRYGQPPSTISTTSSKSFAIPPECGLQIEITISSPVDITKLESRTHPVSIEMGSHGHRTTKNIRDLSGKQAMPAFDTKKARATLSNRDACLGKDFVLFISAKDGQLLASRALSEPHPRLADHSALMVSINLRDLYIPNVVSSTNGKEIIFLADRSGSMQDKMEALKTAMRFFLKSLPNNCTFNICSFGSTYSLMWRKSQAYSQENADTALSYISTHFAADMGGTEILSGLRQVVATRDTTLHTEVIVLTDGEVWRPENVFDFIQQTREPGLTDNIRFFCLGIGPAVSHQLVTGIGRYGGGLAEVMPMDSAGGWIGKVIRMLGAALTPSNWNIDIALEDAAKGKGEAYDCIQAPYRLRDVHAFSRTSVFFLIRRKFDTNVVTVKATSIESGESITVELPIETLDRQGPYIHQLAAKAALRDLESGESFFHHHSSSIENEDSQVATRDLATIEGEKVGIEWQISSKWTSFVVIDTESENHCRLYRAEKSDLAELTRTRLGTGSPSIPKVKAQGRIAQWKRLKVSDRVTGTSSPTMSVEGDEVQRMPAGNHDSESSEDDQFTTSYSSPPMAERMSRGTLSAARASTASTSFADVQNSRMTLPSSPQNLEKNVLRIPRISAGHPLHTGELPPSVLSDRPSWHWASRHSKHPMWRTPSWVKVAPTLEALIDSQRVDGAFQLPERLRTSLTDRFDPGMRISAETPKTELLNETLGETDIEGLLDTVMAIVYIEQIYTNDEALWTLVLQKAKAWLEVSIPAEEIRNRLLDTMRHALRAKLGVPAVVKPKKENAVKEESLSIDEKQKEPSSGKSNAEVPTERIE